MNVFVQLIFDLTETGRETMSCVTRLKSVVAQRNATLGADDEECRRWIGRARTTERERGETV